MKMRIFPIKYLLYLQTFEDFQEITNTYNKATLVCHYLLTVHTKCNGSARKGVAT